MSQRPSHHQRDYSHRPGDRERDSNNPAAQHGRARDKSPGDRQAGFDQRGGYNETAGPGDNRSSLYGNSGQPDYGARRSNNSPYGTQSGNEFPRERSAGGHRGKTPRGYTRSDERIREELCERLTEDDHIDPSEVNVSVRDGVVTLDGSVEQRWIKHNIEDMAEACPGVKDIVNNLRVTPGGRASQDDSGT